MEMQKIGYGKWVGKPLERNKMQLEGGDRPIRKENNPVRTP